MPRVVMKGAMHPRYWVRKPFVPSIPSIPTQPTIIQRIMRALGVKK